MTANNTKLVRMTEPTVAPGPIMERLGHADSITYGGGIIFQTANGPFLEYTEGTENSDDPLEIFRTHIERDVIKQFKVDAEEALDLCETMNLNAKDWLKKARSSDLVHRAECIVDIGTYCGWDIIDEEPLLLGEVELHQRWHAEFNEEGPVTTAGCFKPEIIVPEMMQAIHTIHQKTYWNLLRGRFPLIPSEARQNRNHVWWQQHGNDAVNKVVAIMKNLAPPGYVFEVREEQFGYWRKR